MDRQLRRRGLRANLSAMFGPNRGEALATIPLHVNAGLRRVLNGVGYGLDELIYHGWRRVEVRQPLFIVAPPRSGTTMLFHQLAADPRFAAPTLGNTMLRSVSVNRLLRRAADKQRRAILGIRDAIDQQMSTLDDTHTLRLGRLEEDEAFFNDHYSLLNVHILFPSLAQRLGGIPILDERPPRIRRAVMRRYKNFVRRFLYRVGPDRTYLGKNVQSAGRIGALEQTFPDARYVHIIRDPVQQLPSALELIRAVAKGAHGRVRPPDDPYWRMVADMLIEQHRVLLAWERKLAPARWLTLRYQQLIADPAASVRAVYRHFDIPIPDDLEPTIAAANQRAGEFRKQRRYTLEDYGLAADDVRARLAEVYAAYEL